MKTVGILPTGVAAHSGVYQGSKAYAWTVFALTFGLMLSDYLSRQAMGAVFPFLKVEWGVSDSQLGGLVSIVSLVVGVMTIPFSLIADRWGRVKSITVMAFVWCLATIACGLATNYTEMLIARAVVGFGEAAYAGAGAALLAHTFPVAKRSAVLGAFQSAALFGSVLGVIIGGAVATQFGWRYAFLPLVRQGWCLPRSILSLFVIIRTRDWTIRLQTQPKQRHRSSRYSNKYSPPVPVISPSSPLACRWECRQFLSPGHRLSSIVFTASILRKPR